MGDGHYGDTDSAVLAPSHKGRDKWDFCHGGWIEAPCPSGHCTGRVVPAPHRPRDTTTGEAGPTASQRKMPLFCTKEPASPADAVPLLSAQWALLRWHTWLLSGPWQPHTPRLLFSLPSLPHPGGWQPSPLRETVHRPENVHLLACHRPGVHASDQVCSHRPWKCS